MVYQNVALVGYMRSGKDSIAALLQHLYPKTVKVSFAGALKNEVACALNQVRGESEPFYSEAFFNDDANRPRFRPLLQWWGTEFRRAENPDYWVDVVAEEVESLAPTHPVVCTDGRFGNELRMLRAHRFVIIELSMEMSEIEGYLRTKGLNAEQISAQLSHPSEREWQDSKKDAVLRSTFGNLGTLGRQVVEILTGELTRDTERQIDRFFAELYPSTYGLAVTGEGQ